MSSEDVKPEGEKVDPNIVSIKVRGQVLRPLLFSCSCASPLLDFRRFAARQDGTEVFFKIKRKSPLKKLMDVYAQRQGGTPNAYRFIFDGNRIVETQTPDDVIANARLSTGHTPWPWPCSAPR